MNRPLALNIALIVVLGAVLVAGEAGAAIDADLVNEATVLLKATHGGGAGETGAGVVICVKDGHAYILTAKHVLESEPGKRARGLTLTVSFFQNRWPEIESAAGSFEYKWAQTKDLALIKVKLAGEGPRPIIIGDSRGIAVGADIATTGHPVDLQSEWVFRKGDLSKKGEFLEYGAPVGKGYSGGPLVDADGDLVGINVRVKQGTQGASLAAAIPVNEVLTTIENWLDTSCLQRRNAPAAPGGPTVAGGDVEDIADEYWAARDRGETASSWYAAWYDRMAAAMEADEEFIDNDLLMLEVASLALPPAGQAADEDDLEIIDDALDNLGLGDTEGDGGWMATQPGGTAAGIEYFILAGYSEPGVGAFVPPQVTGEMTVTENPPGFFHVESSMQAGGVSYFTVYEGTIQNGAIFTGTVLNSNYYPAGTGVVIGLYSDGYNLTMTLPDGTIYQWAKN